MELEDSKKKVVSEYEVEHLTDILEDVPRLSKLSHRPITSILRFLMKFPTRVDVLSFTLQIFKRVFNSFPSLRKDYSEAVVSLLSNILNAL